MLTKNQKQSKNTEVQTHANTHTHKTHAQRQKPHRKALAAQQGGTKRRKQAPATKKKSQNQNTAKPQRKDDRDYHHHHHHHHKKTTMNSTVVAAASAVIKTSARRTIQVPKNVEQRRIAHNWMYASLSDPTLSSWDPHGHVGTVAGSTSDYHPDDSYPSMVDETLNQIFEINRLGKDEVCSWESTVRSYVSNGSEATTCSVCGSPKCVTELCTNCSRTAQEDHEGGRQ